MPVINDTVIGKLNPITKIAAVFALGLSALAWPDFTLGLILVVLLLVVSFLAHIQRDFAKIMFGFGIPVTVMLMFIQGCTVPRTVPHYWILASRNWGSKACCMRPKWW